MLLVDAPIIVRASRVFTAANDEVMVDGVVRIEGDTITGIGTPDDFGTTAEAVSRLDGTLLPGFVDTHAHITLAGAGLGSGSVDYPEADVAVLIAVGQLRRHLSAGVTTMLDCGGKGTTVFAIRQAVETGAIPGPRLRVCGRPITHSRGHIHMAGAVADGPEEVRREVRILASQGADMIKIVASGGSSGGIPSRASYSVSELAAGVEAAHQLGLRVTAHCRAADAVLTCVDAGVDSIGHLEFLQPGPLRNFGGGAPTSIPRYDERIGTILGGFDRAVGFPPALQRLGHSP